MPIDLAQLKSEIQTDPKSLGYANMSTGWIAAKLNETGASAETCDVATITSMDAFAAVDVGEYSALSAAARDAWGALIAAGSANGIPVEHSAIRSIVAAIWGAGTSTRDNLVALQTKSASRAEVLFGDGTSVDHRMVAEALKP